MAVKKFAISLPQEVMAEIDRAAAERGITRSSFITRVLREVARARRDAEITRKINRFFLDPEIQYEQRETALGYAHIMDKKGTEW